MLFRSKQSGIEEIEAREDELDLWNVRLSQKISKVLVDRKSVV